jgi:hypothetical protein
MQYYIVYRSFLLFGTVTHELFKEPSHLFNLPLARLYMTFHYTYIIASDRLEAKNLLEKALQSTR